MSRKFYYLFFFFVIIKKKEEKHLPFGKTKSAFFITSTHEILAPLEKYTEQTYSFRFALEPSNKLLTVDKFLPGFSQSLHYCHHSFSEYTFVDVSFEVLCLQLDRGPQVWSDQCRVAQSNHLLYSRHYTLINTAQDHNVFCSNPTVLLSHSS